MTTSIEVAESLAEAVSTVLQCSPFPQPVPRAPGAQVVEEAYDPRMVMSKSKAMHTFTVWVFMPAGNADSSMRKLAEYGQPSGQIISAIEDGANWSATVDYASVTNVGQPGWTQIGDVTYASRAFTVEVVW